jgi:hypothetical protein
MDQQLPEFVIAQALVRATRDVPGIADVYSGRLGEIATYGRGTRVPGIRVHTEGGRLKIEVHVIALYSPDLRLSTLADAVRTQMRQQLVALAVDQSNAIDVVIADLKVDAS